EKFQMSFMGELTFFLGLQVKQKKDGIFTSQDKYVAKLLKKFRLTEVKTTSTSMESQKPLLKDEDGEEVDVHMYRYQVNPKVSHLHALKRICRYALKVSPTIYISSIELFSSTAMAKTINGEAQLHAKVDGKKIIVTELSVRRDLRLVDEEGKSTTTTISSQQSQDKGKGIMIEEPVKPKKKDQIKLDEEAAKKLQAKFDEEERLAKEKAEKEERANIALIEE
nr:hypothetical protein [Tanacetum cinerariifolium]